jgi:hypothetical protein
VQRDVERRKESDKAEEAAEEVHGISMCKIIEKSKVREKRR